MKTRICMYFQEIRISVKQTTAEDTFVTIFATQKRAKERP